MPDDILNRINVSAEQLAALLELADERLAAKQPKPLIPLDDFNKKRGQCYESVNTQMPRNNGIACPKCGAGMVDSSPNLTLTSNPPQKYVSCPSCKHTGYRIA